MNDIEKININDYIYIPWFESPSVKYLFEYEKLRSKKGNVYSNRFIFEYLHYSNNNKLKMNEYDLILTGQGILELCKCKWR